MHLRALCNYTGRSLLVPFLEGIAQHIFRAYKNHDDSILPGYYIISRSCKSIKYVKLLL